MSQTAAERRKNVATPEGRGFVCMTVASRAAAKDSFATPWLPGVERFTTAFSRGYALAPLRGFKINRYHNG